MGAIADCIELIIFRNERVIREAGVSEAVFNAVRDKELDEIKRRRARYLHAPAVPNLKGRNLIVIDDGIATGATMRAALQALRKGTASATDRCGSGRCCQLAVGAARHGGRDRVPGVFPISRCHWRYYEDFEQVSDQEVLEILASLPSEPPPPPGREGYGQPGVTLSLAQRCDRSVSRLDGAYPAALLGQKDVGARQSVDLKAQPPAFRSRPTQLAGRWRK